MSYLEIILASPILLYFLKMIGPKILSAITARSLADRKRSKQQKVYNEVKGHLRTARNKFDIKNIAVIDFHNGGTLNGRSAQYFTVSYEEYRGPEDSISKYYQAAPMDPVHWELLGMYTIGEALVLDVHHLPEELASMKPKMALADITKYVAIGLYTSPRDETPSAIVSCALDEHGHDIDGLIGHLQLINNQMRQIILK